MSIPKYGYFRKDEWGHSYVIPEDKIEEFDNLSEKINDAPYYSDKWYDHLRDFNDYFGFRRVNHIYGYKILLCNHPDFECSEEKE